MLRTVHVHAICGNMKFKKYVMLKTYKTMAFFAFFFSEKRRIPCKSHVTNNKQTRQNITKMDLALILNIAMLHHEINTIVISRSHPMMSFRAAFNAALFEMAVEFRSFRNSRAPPKWPERRLKVEFPRVNLRAVSNGTV